MNSSSLNSAPSGRFGYLVSQYPAVNHAFMFREIRELRRLGFQIEVFSISDPDRPSDRLTSEEQEEARGSYYVKAQSALAVLVAQLRCFAARPAKYLAGMLFAAKMGRGRPKSVARQLLYFAEAIVVGEQLLKRGISHLHVHYSSTVALILSRIYPVSISITMHGPDEFSDPEGFHLTEKIAASQFVCAISDFGRSQLMRYSRHADWHKLYVVRLGVDTDQLRPHPSSRISPHTFRMLCAGRLAPVKGQHILLDAVANLVKRGYSDIELLLAGDGPDRGSLEQHAVTLGLGNKVTFKGFVNQDQMRELYGQVDAFVLPSFAEGLPVVLMEAMALGVPCIATWVNGVPELIRDGLDGYTVAPGDVVSLEAAIERLLTKPELRVGLARAGRERAVELVDLKKNVLQLSGVLSKYLHQPKEQVRVTSSVAR